MAELDEVQGVRSRDGIVRVEFLRFIDRQVDELFRMMPSSLLPRARRQLRKLVENLSATQSGPQYLNWVGELAATVYLLRTTGAELVGIEKGIAGRNTSLDVLIRLKSGTRISVEFLAPLGNSWVKAEPSKGVISTVGVGGPPVRGEPMR
jgi:hypothetical protein